MIRWLENFLTHRFTDSEARCAGEVDSTAAVAAGLNEWFPEFDPECRPQRHT